MTDHDRSGRPPRDLPTFIIAGAARAGTTTLYSWLADHPEVHMSAIKETNFFCPPDLPLGGPGDRKILETMERPSRHLDRNVAAVITDEDEYRAQFAAGADQPARGEASPSYLYYHSASAVGIDSMIPDCRIVILLREPVSRAVSHYKVMRAWARETLSFQDAIAQEEARKQAGWEWSWDYRGVGMYADAVEEYLRVFGTSRVGTWLHERMLRDPATVFAEVCAFLGLDSSYPLPLESHNESPREVATGINRVRNRWPRAVSMVEERIPTSLLMKARPALARVLGTEQLTVPAGYLAGIKPYFAADIARLSRLLPNLSFEGWGFGADGSPAAARSAHERASG